MVTVSVCIVTYNSAEDISSCLDAVMLQSQPVQSIIIVDNASADRSVELVKERMNEATPIVLIENKINNGFAGGQNQAIAATDSDYVLVLNPDVELYPDYIKILVDRLERDSHAGSATGLLKLKSNPSIVDSTGLQMGLNRHALDRGAGQPIDMWLEPGEVFGVSGAAALYARRMINDISLEGEFFDEHFFAYKEDVDVAWRARLLGWSSYYDPTSQGIHARGWQTGGRRSISLFVRQHSYINQLFMIVKNEQCGWHWVKVLPIVFLREVTKLLYILIRERELLSSWKLVFKALPSMIRKRKLLLDKITKKKTKL
ncbi:glycosyltransferase family 2 protein [Paenibacillus endoradicis]|uniref:glycosyltransferase family 2 protein n=1 Tax=Paenibacillus endoradicis TaxID=2972487 RepID=UPI00215992CE|nr:glycosyltransferase family 2 protein [Paenibacillus endoradicis]MCR8659829.1 glycosyltransferase family 2 protein [Paenibacillus endoradicis]